ncbi:replication initiator protein A [uncultured Fusobacterium sp.]|uniref:replication initiator protein A n=1 Tax=uncultured Fusobacterium sp. TaxID=159267 RepID=UPI0025EFA873|nr:replication initiator protein A [uncultured Fusobacterium sp.]
MREININDLNNINYYQVPKWLMELFLNGEITAGAFKTYVLMYDRLRISGKNNWVDNDGVVYIKYSYNEMMEDLKVSRQAVSNNIKDLEKLDLIRKIRNFNSTNKFYLKIYDECKEDLTSQKNFTIKEDLTTKSKEELTRGSQIYLDTNKNNLSKNNYNKNNDDNIDNLDDIDQEVIEVKEDKKDCSPKGSSSPFDIKTFKEIKDIAVKATGVDRFRIDNLMPISNFRDIDLSLLLLKIKESDFLQGKSDKKPNINHFSVRNMIERILADAYKTNKSDDTQVPKSPSRRVYIPEKVTGYGLDENGIFDFKVGE